VTRRGDEAQPEALEIVEGVVERVNFKLAAVAGAGVDFADGEAAAKSAPRGAIKTCREFGKRRVVGSRRLFGQRAACEPLRATVCASTKNSKLRPFPRKRESSC
jgi:hypothetical protein